MTGYIKKFKDTNTKTIRTTMSLRVRDKQLLKSYIKIWGKIEQLMGINFDSKPFYGNDDNKYVKAKKHLRKTLLQIFVTKKYLKKMYHINVNVYQ